MFNFSSKVRGLFIEQNENATLLARASGFEAPFVVEELRECPPNTPDAVREAVRGMFGKQGKGYVHACCSTYPTGRILRRASLDAKRLKEPTYLNEVLTTQFRLEPDKHTLAVLNAGDGSDFDTGKAHKEVLFCGAPSEEVIAAQNRFLELNIYPERLEVGTVSVLGGVLHYLSLKQIKAPTLLLEVGPDAIQSFILSPGGVDVARPIAQGINALIPVVQKELGLKDEESARKLFFSNSFDFTGMGPQLLRRLVKELQSSIGFYEVQTGQSIGQVLISQMPTNLSWLSRTLATSLGVQELVIDMPSWLESLQITLAPGATPTAPDARWLGLFSLMGAYHAVLEEKR